MRKNGTLKRTFAMALVYAMLMENVSGIMPVSYAEEDSTVAETTVTTEETRNENDTVDDTASPAENNSTVEGGGSGSGTQTPVEEHNPTVEEHNPTVEQDNPTVDQDNPTVEQVNPIVEQDENSETEEGEESEDPKKTRDVGTSEFTLLINGERAENLTIFYGQPISFSLSGHTTGEEVVYSYTTPENVQDDIWENITDGVCILEPGAYLFRYDVTIDDKDWIHAASEVTVAKGTVGAPGNLAWQGSQMTWSAPDCTDLGGTLDGGVIQGYKVQVYKDGAEYTTLKTAAGQLSYNNFANEIKADGGAGRYSFTVQAELDENNAHYSGAAVSAFSGAYTVPEAELVGLPGTEGLTPDTKFLLLPGNTEAGNNSRSISTAVLDGYQFDRWEGSGVSFANANDASTVVTVNDDYAGETELKIYAKAKDVVAPAVTAFAANAQGTLAASASDGHSGIAAYAFSTAAAAGDVPGSEWQSVSDVASGEKSFEFAPTAGGEYYFYVMDADDNTARSENAVSVTEAVLKDWDNIGETRDRAVFLTGDYKTLPTPVSAGYIFCGWYENEECTGTAVTAPEHSTDAALTFYAKWEKESLDVPAMSDIIQVYDAKEHTLSVSLPNTGRLQYQWFKDGQEIEGATGASITVRNVSDSGKYHVNVWHYNARGEQLGAGNSTATVDISPREVVVAPEDESIVYGEARPEFTAEFRPVVEDGEVKENTGLVAGDEASVTAGTFDCGYAQWNNVGTYDVTASGFTSDNYNISHASGALTVAAREYPSDISAQIVYANAEERWFAYTGEEIKPTLKITDAWNNNSVLTEGKDYTLEYVNNINASADKPAVNITFTGNYSGSESLSFEIRPTGFEARTVMDGWTYGDKPSEPSVDENRSGGEVRYTYRKTKDSHGNEVENGAETDVRPTEAGTYRITAHIAGNENFEPVTAQPCEFTIARREITIKTESFTFEYDGLPHSYREYKVEGDFAAGEGFKYITVTGERTKVTDAEGVDNTVKYELNSAANEDNYHIIIVCGKLIVKSVKLTVPSNAVWQSYNPGTATWVAVSKDGLTAQYELQLYSCTDGEPRKVGDAVTVSATSYDFSDAIRADAEAHPGASYRFTIKTVPVGENAGNYEKSDVSEMSGELCTVTVTAEGDDNVSDALLCRAGTTEKTKSLVLINGESATLSASTKPGYSVMEWVCGEGLTLSDLTVTAVLTQSIASTSVKALTSDEAPVITEYTAVNTEDYKVELHFTAADVVGLAGWQIKKDSSTPAADDPAWNDISGTEYPGVYTPTESGKYYLFVKDTAGSIVCSASVENRTDPETGEIIQIFTPEYRGVNAITLAPGEGASGENKVIFKAENTTITLPAAFDCGFVNDGYAFRNWHAASGIYEDEARYGANRDEVLTATWTNQHFDYFVDYYYMNPDGAYPDAPEYTAKFNAPYGKKLSFDDAFLQRVRTGFTLDASEGHTESIKLTSDSLRLKVFYKRNSYTITYRYTMPGNETEKVETAQYLYGAELGEALFEQAKPQAEGYTFVGWSFDDSEHMPATMPANNVTARGEFIPNQGNVHLRFFMQGLDGETYELDESMSREITGRHGEEITVNADNADTVEGFTYAGAYASFGSGYDGATMPVDAKAELTEAASAVEGNELYINLFYTRNEYTVTLEVWQGDVGDGKIKYTNSWKALYGADLTDGEVTAERMESYEQEKWECDNGYVLAALVSWSTDERPETMPAGDVKVSRQFIPKVAGKFTVELWTEGETAGEYLSQTFTYLGNVGTEVTIGSGEGFTVDYTKLASAVPGFKYYDYKEETVHGGTVTSAVVTDTNNGEAPAVLRIFFERKIVDITLKFYEVNGNSQTEIATATKQSKWGSNYTYDYELLALFYSSGSFAWKEQPVKAELTGTPSVGNYCANKYVVSYSAYHNLNDDGHWPSGTLNTVASLSGEHKGTVGVDGTNVNIYYTNTDPKKEQYYLDVVYNTIGLTYGNNEDVPVTYTVDGTVYKVRVANVAYFYSDAEFVPDKVDERYPGLAYYNVGSGETGGHFTYNTLREGVVPYENYYIEGDYIYIPLSDNRLFYNNFTSYSYPYSYTQNQEIGNEAINAFLNQYKALHPDDAGAQGAKVYNHGWGRSFLRSNSKLVVTFINGPTYHIYYNVNGNVCNEHEHAAGAKIESVGCDHGIYTQRDGYKIVWYMANHEELIFPFTLNGDITLYGEYEKTDIASKEYAYYELADHVKEVAYITAENRGSFELIKSTDADGTVTYSYNGSVVMVEKPIVSESFTEISMDASEYARSGFAYDSANSANRLKGYVAAKPIALSAYFKRNEHSLTVDSAIPDTNVQSSRVRFGQSVELGVLSRSGYTFAGWKVTDASGAEIDEDSIKRNEDGSVTLICPDADITATAQWTTAAFTQTVIHYYQNSDLSFDKAAVAEMMADASAEDIDINGNPGKKYANGGVSYTADGKTYYYNSADKVDGVYVLRPENLCAVVCEVTVMQDESASVSGGIISADEHYDYSFTVHKSGEGDIVKLGEDGEYKNAVDMEVEYYYTLRGGYKLSLSAACTNAELPEVTFTGAGEDYYYSENVAVSVALPAGYEFDGWRENGEIVTTDKSFTASMTEDKSFVAVIHALPVSGVKLTVSGVTELTYGYAMSETNSVSAAVKILEEDTANYIKSYCWYIMDESGKFVSLKDGSSATYKIPAGWGTGDYTLKCVVTVARKDNELERSFESAEHNISVVKADMTVGCTNYSGVYDGKEHAIALSVAGMTEGEDYTVYYADEPLNAENYASAGSTKKLAFTDAGEHTVYYYMKATAGNFKDFTGIGKVNITPKLLTVSAGGAFYHKTYDGTKIVRGAVTEEGSDMNKLCTTEGIYVVHGLVGTDSMDTYVVCGKASFNSKDVRDANMLDFSELQLVNRTTGAVNRNYYFAEGYGIVLSAYIDRMPITLQWMDTTLSYNGTQQLPSAAITDTLPEGDSLNVAVSGAQTTAGSYTASANITAGNDKTDVNNFALKNGSQPYVIGRIALTIAPEANSVPITYDGKAHTLEKFEVVSGTLLEKQTFTAKTDRAETNAGEHDIMAKDARVFDAGGVDVTDNFDLRYESAKLTIAQREVTVSGLLSADKSYDGNTDAAVSCGSVNFGNIVEGDELALDAEKITASFDNANAGTNKTVTFTVKDGALTGRSAGNYVLNAKDSDLTATASITRAEITVTANDTSTVYGENAVFTVSFSGFVDGEGEGIISDRDKITYTIKAADQDAKAYDTKVPAGSYTILADVSRLAADNYSFKALPGTLTVTQRPVTVGAAENALIEKVYDGTAAASADSSKYVFGTVSGNTASGVVNGDSIGLNFKALYNSKNVDEAKTVTFNDLGITNANYTLVTESFTVPGSISSAPLTVTVNNRVITYGDAKPTDFTVSASGFVNGETLSVLSTQSAAFTCEYDSTDINRRAAKAYTISVSGVTANNGNYKISYADGTLTVKKAVITVTAVLGKSTAVYGDEPIPNVSFESTGYQYGDSFRTVVKGSVGYDYGGLETQEIDGKTVISSVPGEYTITPNVSGLSADNYTFAAEGAKLTVQKYKLKISNVSIKPRVYDGTTNVYGSQIDLANVKADGLLKIDQDEFDKNKNELIDVSAEYTGENAKNVGTDKDISISITFKDYLNDRCYVADNCQKEATSDITARPLRITADNKETLYGTAAPAFTVTYGKTVTNGVVNPDSGFVNGESAGITNVTCTCNYQAAGGNFSDVGNYVIDVSDFTDSDTALSSNYAPEYVPGTLTVKQNKLPSPVVSWDGGTPGLARWEPSENVGNVSAASYTAVLYKDGTAISESTVTVSAGETLEKNFAELIRSTGAGAYTVEVTANASEENNSGKKNVTDSDPGRSGSLSAARVSFVFASDAETQAGKGDTISINGAGSYVMIAGEKGVSIAATLKNGTGYTIKSVTSDNAKLTVSNGTDTDKPVDRYEGAVSLAQDFSGASEITVTLALNSIGAEISVVVSPRPGAGQASCIYGYSKGPDLTATVTPVDKSTGYTYEYKWEIRYGGRYDYPRTYNSAEATDTLSFPTGYSANTSPDYYTVRCIVTATRKDNGNSYSCKNTWKNTEDHVTNVTVNRATFTASVSMDGWTYGETRNSPTLNCDIKDNAIINEGRYVFLYKSADAPDESWSRELPTDAGQYQVKAYIPTDVNYEESTTAPIDFEIQKAKLVTPTNLTMAASDTAPYGLISWDSVNGVQENNGVESESAVSVTYTVKLYKGDDDNPKVYSDLSGCSLDITDDLQSGGIFYYTVTAVSSNEANCDNSDESEPYKIAVNGTIDVSSKSKMYDGEDVTLKAVCNNAISYEWYKGNEKLNLTADSITALHVADSGSYTCVITDNAGKVYTPKASVSITKRSVTLTSATDTKVYDAAPLTNGKVDVSGDGFAKDEGASYTVTGSRLDVGSCDNSFTYTLNKGTDAGDYVIKTVNGKLTVTARTIADNIEFNIVQPADVVYRGSAFTPKIAVKDLGLSGGTERTLTEGTDYTYSYENNVNAGTATVTITGKGNYQGSVSRTFTIEKRPVSFVGETKTLEYNGTLQELTGINISSGENIGLVSGHTHNVTYSAKGTEASAAPYQGTITEAADVCVMADGTDITNNYDISTQAGSLTINQTAASWSVTLADDALTYNGKERESSKHTTSTSKTGEVTYSYSYTKDGEEVSAPKDAGVYIVNVSAVNPNYTNTATTTATLTIKPAVYNVSTDGDSKVYDGTPLTKAEGNVSGLVDGESVTFKTTGSITDAGTTDNTYEIEWTNANADNYVIGTENLGKLTVTKAKYSVKTYGAERVYNGEALTAGGEINGIIESERGSVQLETTGSITNVGTENNTYEIAWNGVKSANYELETAEIGVLKVTQKSATITVSDASKVYGQPDPKFTHRIDGLVGNDTLGNVSCYRGNSDVEAAGVYKNVLTASCTGNDNYDVTVVNGTFTIERSNALTVSAENVSVTYDGMMHGCTPKANITEGTTLSYSTDGGVTWSSTLPKIKDAGSITVTVKAENANYVTAECTCTVTVSPRAASITVHDKSKVYGQSDPEFTGKIDGLLGSDTLGTVTYYRTNSKVEAAGVYTGVLDARYEGNSNYTVTVNRGKFTITQADGLLLYANDVTATYDGKPHSMQPTANIIEGTTISYSTDGGKTYSDELPKLTDAGSLTVRAKAENRNYAAVTAEYTILVKPAEVTVTAQAMKKTYGDSDPASFKAVVSGMVNNESASEKLSYNMSRTAGENVGDYTISFTGDERQGNYHITFVSGKFTIEPRTLALVWSIRNVPDDGETFSGVSSVTYDGKDKTAEAAFANLVTRAGKTDDVAVTGYTGDVKAQNVGSYHTAVTGITGRDSGNYVLADTDFDWLITARPLADSGSKDGYAEGIKVDDVDDALYNGTWHKPKVTVKDELVSGGVKLKEGTDYTVSYAENRNAGTAKITITGKGNYGMSIVKNFTILPKAVTLSWDESAFDYNGEYRSVSAVVTNAVAGDRVTVSSYGGNSAVNSGSYTATAYSLGGDSAGNYTLTDAEGVSQAWVINPARLKVTADDKSSELGTALQELTYTLTGTVYGKDVPGKFVLTTTAKDAEGSFPITVKVENANPNYEISVETGVYTLTAAKTVPGDKDKDKDKDEDKPEEQKKPAESKSEKLTDVLPESIAELIPESVIEVLYDILDELVPQSGVFNENDDEQGGITCVWHRLIILSDLLFALGLALTMRREKADTPEDRKRRHRRRSIALRVCGFVLLMLVCILSCILGFCRLELPLTAISGLVMGTASALLYRRKFSEKEETAESV